MTVALANGGKQERRRELDFYPTPPDVTHALMRFLALPQSLVWEPACGDGAMSKVIQSYGHTVIGSDIRDGVDYLTAKPAPQCGYGAIITNPPFNLSEQFIRKAIGEAPVVAMLLKSQYWHAAKRSKLFAEHPPAFVLALSWRPDFRGGELGGAPTMEVLWSVWERGKTDTRYRILPRP
jgi:hypothetical protein